MNTNRLVFTTRNRLDFSFSSSSLGLKKVNDSKWFVIILLPGLCPEMYASYVCLEPVVVYYCRTYTKAARGGE